MEKASTKDFFREILKNKGRFISIVFIVMLGTAFFAGLRSTSYDMKYSADIYYDDAKLMDIRVLGTMGIGEEDVEDISAISGVDYAVGSQIQGSEVPSSELVHRSVWFYHNSDR